jgi:hypothetical protein
MNTPIHGHREPGCERREVRRGHRLMWAAGLVVVGGAGLLTAHGLIEVARGSEVPESIAWLYPVITDGLALVAYAATSRLSRAGRRYAWSVVVLAAGLSAIAQATFLAAGQPDASAQLRFTVGAWPAIAAAIAAHLLFLIGEHGRASAPTGQTSVTERDSRGTVGSVSVDLVGSVGDRSAQGVPAVPAGVPALNTGVPPESDTGVPAVPAEFQMAQPSDLGARVDPFQVERSPGMRPALSARDRAVTVAHLHRRRQGQLPSVRELVELADVGQGTAARALQELREAEPGLHLVTEQDQPGDQA